MDIALIADLHGNLPALETVARDIARRGIREIWCLGDLVGKGPSSPETMDWALAHCRVILQGNWDKLVAERAFPNDAFYYDQLGAARMKKLSELPLEHETTAGGLRLRLMHGRPVMTALQFIQDEAGALAWLFSRGEQTFDAVGYADCHRAGLRTLGAGYLFNTGSVGNAMGVPRAHYAILRDAQSECFELSFISLSYDNERAVRDALAAPGLPRGDAYVREVRTGVYSRG